MSIDIGYGLRKPEDGDKNFWDLIENLFDAFVGHTHDASNSPSVPAANIVKKISTLASADWTPVAGIGYIQTITVPSGVSLDKSEPVFYISSGPSIYKRIYPTVNPTSLITMEVTVNDNSLELKVIYL